MNLAKYSEKVIVIGEPLSKELFQSVLSNGPCWAGNLQCVRNMEEEK